MKSPPLSPPPASSPQPIVWTVWLSGAILAFAPLIRGGNRPLALLTLELAALLLLALTLWTARGRPRMPNLLSAALTGLLLLPLLYLVPLPADWLEIVPGRALYNEALAALGLARDWVPWSVVPLLTEQAWLALLPPLVLFWAVLSLRASDVERLVLLFLGMAALQALLALIQFGSGGEMLAELGIGTGGGSGEGTYANRNHLAGLLEMALPIALALLAASVFGLDRATRHPSRRRQSWWRRLRRIGAAEGQANRTLLYAALAILLLLGLIFSRSRAGMALSMLCMLSIMVLLARNFGRRFSRHVVGAVTAAGLLLATMIGLAPVLSRFALDPLADLRWVIFDVSWQAARDFLPFGSGPGTYAEVIRAYHPEAVGGEAYINHAHQDYLEWLVEGGVPALLLMILFLLAWLKRWPAIWGTRNWESLHMMQTGAGLGMLLLLLHGFVDYNLRIPANQIYFAFLAAVFFHSGVAAGHRGERRHRHRHELHRRQDDESPSKTAPFREGDRPPDDSPLSNPGPPTPNPGSEPPVQTDSGMVANAWARPPPASGYRDPEDSATS